MTKYYKTSHNECKIIHDINNSYIINEYNCHKNDIYSYQLNFYLKYKKHTIFKHKIKFYSLRFSFLLQNTFFIEIILY